MRRILVFILLSLPLSFIFSQIDSTKKDTLSFYDMSIEELKALKAHGVPSELEKIINSLISVASKKPQNVRESPSIVSLVTKEEIRNSGARDLIDVLRLVPGFDFGVDVEGVVGIGVRGNWAHEGKILLLIDGQEMNEIFFATNQFGNHFPIDHIEKIEIIRGPGSAIYGGFAEYGVINIITRKGEDINGVSVSGIYTQMKNTYGQRNINLSVGKKIKDFEFSLSGLTGQGNRSDRDFNDFYGDTFNLAGNSNLNPTFLNLGMKYKDLSVRAIGDFYNVSVRDAYDVNKSEPYKESFNSLFTEVKYVWKINDKFTLTPRFNSKSQTPWKTAAVDSITEPYFRTAMRTTGNLTLSYNITRKINFVFGGEFYADKAKDRTDSLVFADSTKEVSYYNYAFFTQGLVKTRFVNIVLGARFDKHNAYGSAFVPRVGFTKKYKKFHFKALYSNAFRAPSIENIDLQDSTGIKPELTSVIEIEAGYQFFRKSFLTANFYDITTKNPIVYYYDSQGLTDSYRNFGHSGTRGVEVEYRFKEKWGYINFNYSFYTANGKKKIDDYRVSEDSAALLGFANHKFNLNASFKIKETGLSINPSLSFFGTRWAYTSVDSLGTSVLEKINPSILTNLSINYDSPVKGLTIGIGCYNLLDDKFSFIQPYNGYHAPLPGPSREIVLRLRYELKFKKKEVLPPATQ
ncbi:MAG: TonB-dependent receptor plug domain-containing protein [Bacteroidia bacterium]|nr:TonB-dependent receptor plug domain-containing protein [Bacteroidia bacterium]